MVLDLGSLGPLKTLKTSGYWLTEIHDRENIEELDFGRKSFNQDCTKYCSIGKTKIPT